MKLILKCIRPVSIFFHTYDGYQIKNKFKFGDKVKARSRDYGVDIIFAEGAYSVPCDFDFVNKYFVIDDKDKFYQDSNIKYGVGTLTGYDLKTGKQIFNIENVVMNIGE